ncbi:MAG: VC0807 family protein [Acidimicrobiia bacterium]
MPTPHFEIPRIREIVSHSWRNVLECTIAPVVLFLLALRLLGIWGAVIAGLAWSYGNVGRRLVRGRRVPGILVLGALTLTVRTALVVATGSTFLYFLQPTLGTAVVAVAFLLSVPIGHPLAQRLATDFLPIPADFLADDRVRRFFLRITLLWAFTQFANAGITLWLLTTQSVATFVVARSVVSATCTGAAILASTLWFKRSMHAHGLLMPRASAA